MKKSRVLACASSFRRTGRDGEFPVTQVTSLVSHRQRRFVRSRQNYKTCIKTIEQDNTKPTLQTKNNSKELDTVSCDLLINITVATLPLELAAQGERWHFRTKTEPSKIEINGKYAIVSTNEG
jgi:hypothetical protein